MQEALNNKWTMEVFKVKTKQSFNVSIFFTPLLIVLQIKKKNASKSYKPHPPWGFKMNTKAWCLKWHKTTQKKTVTIPRRQHKEVFSQRNRSCADAVHSLEGLHLVREHLHQVDKLAELAHVYKTYSVEKRSDNW